MCDAEGVRLGIATGRSRWRLRRAIGKADANAARGVPGPRVSRAARAHLGRAPGRGFVVRTALVFLLPTVAGSLYVAAVRRIGGQWVSPAVTGEPARPLGITIYR
ncbi:hypothetical protein GCM10010358_69300 [Streptomyces minutiscleroticus]|uniref:Uncharacterized protein n=1 Tax=Streptomyces minutiscleroticus TaxID=68238 RepID=A0A918NYS3_9ACTN|nr:hypothetical protein GCM10010358_69300 [Streptomyces minutiscleroticus]